MKNEISNAASVLGRKGGSVKSEAKTKAARENGKRGGRPRKSMTSPPVFSLYKDLP